MGEGLTIYEIRYYVGSLWTVPKTKIRSHSPLVVLYVVLTNCIMYIGSWTFCRDPPLIRKSQSTCTETKKGLESPGLKLTSSIEAMIDADVNI